MGTDWGISNKLKLNSWYEPTPDGGASSAIRFSRTLISFSSSNRVFLRISRLLERFFLPFNTFSLDDDGFGIFQRQTMSLNATMKCSSSSVGACRHGHRDAVAAHRTHVRTAGRSRIAATVHWSLGSRVSIMVRFLLCLK